MSNFDYYDEIEDEEEEFITINQEYHVLPKLDISFIADVKKELNLVRSMIEDYPVEIDLALLRLAEAEILIRESKTKMKEYNHEK